MLNKKTAAKILSEIKKAKKVLGWEVTRSLEDGMRETIKYFEGKEIVLNK